MLESASSPILGLTMGLLLVTNKMLMNVSRDPTGTIRLLRRKKLYLDARNNPLGLDSLDSLVSQRSGQVRIVGETLPISAPNWKTPQRPDYRSKKDVDPLPLELSTQGVGSSTCKLTVPAVWSLLAKRLPLTHGNLPGARMDSARKAADEVCRTQAIRSVSKTKAGELDVGTLDVDGGNEAVAAVPRISRAAGKSDLHCMSII